MNQVLCPSKPTRTESLDVMKCLAAFLVVYIHAGYPGFLGGTMMVWTRAAVPFFFLITGYYYPMMKDKGRLNAYLRHVVGLTLGATLLYFLVNVANALESDNWQPMLDGLVCGWRWRDFLLYNAPHFGFHLWYFWALIYILLILRLADKFSAMSLLYYAAPMLWMVNALMEFGLWDGSSRNFLFLGLPYVCLGRWLAEHNITQKTVDQKGRVLLLLSAIGLVMMATEFLAYKHFNLPSVRDHYLFIPLFIVPLLLWSQVHPHWGSGTWLARNGRKESAYVYIVHVAVLVYLNKFCEHQPWYIYSRLYLVYALSVALAFGYNWMKALRPKKAA